MTNKINEFLDKKNWVGAFIAILCAGFVGLWAAFLNSQNQLSKCQAETQLKVNAAITKWQNKADSITISKDLRYDLAASKRAEEKDAEIEDLKQTLREIQGLNKQKTALIESTRKKSYRNSVESELVKSKAEKLQL